MREEPRVPPEKAYTVVTDSHCRRFIKEMGYGFIAEVWWDLPMLQVRPCNKGRDMDLGVLREIAEHTLGKGPDAAHHAVDG